MSRYLLGLLPENFSPKFWFYYPNANLRTSNLFAKLWIHIITAAFWEGTIPKAGSKNENLLCLSVRDPIIPVEIFNRYEETIIHINPLTDNRVIYGHFFWTLTNQSRSDILIWNLLTRLFLRSLFRLAWFRTTGNGNFTIFFKIKKKNTGFLGLNFWKIDFFTVDRYLYQTKFNVKSISRFLPWKSCHVTD